MTYSIEWTHGDTHLGGWEADSFGEAMRELEPILENLISQGTEEEAEMTLQGQFIISLDGKLIEVVECIDCRD